MAASFQMNAPLTLTRKWTLVRYAVEITQQSPLSTPNSSSSNERQPAQRQLLDAAEGLLSLLLASTQQLYVVRDETDQIECVDLLTTETSSIVGTYSGDSLLLSYLIPHDNVQRKFLVKFASTVTQTGRQHCEECVRLLSHSIKVTHFDSTSTSAANDNSNSILSTAEMIKVLMNESPANLSTYYHQEMAFDRHRKDAFIEKCLLDETFPDFVATVASILDTMKDATK